MMVLIWINKKPILFHVSLSKTISTISNLKHKNLFKIVTSLTKKITKQIGMIALVSNRNYANFSESGDR